MNKFEKEVIDRLARIESNIDNLKGDLTQDYHVLHGNGKPGLIDRITALETHEKDRANHHGLLAGIIGFLVNAAIALYAALKNQT